MNYDYNIPKNLCGTIRKKEIEIFVVNHSDAEEIASTIIHEVSHKRFNWDKTQEDEINCYLMEVMFINNDITEDDIIKIVEYVKSEYKKLPKGELYGY